MACDCDTRIRMYEANLVLVKLVHTFMHDEDVNLPWRPIPAHSLATIKKKALEMKAFIGTEASEKISQAVDALAAVLEELQQPQRPPEA